VLINGKDLLSMCFRYSKMAYSKLHSIGKEIFRWRLDIPEEVYVASTLTQLRFESPSFTVRSRNGAEAIIHQAFSLVVHIAKKVVN